MKWLNWFIVTMFTIGLVVMPIWPAQAQLQLVPCRLARPAVNLNNAFQLEQDPRPPCTVQHLFGLLVGIYNFLLGLMALIAVLIMVYTGIRMLIYQYEEEPETELKHIKLTFRRALFGIIIIICAYLMVYTLLLVLGVGSGPSGPGTLNCFLKQFGFLVGAGC